MSPRYEGKPSTGAAAALLEAVVDLAESVALWGADPNPRAQAFYRKHGFVADGTAQVEGGVREIRIRARAKSSDRQLTCSDSGVMRLRSGADTGPSRPEIDRKSL